MIPIDWYVVEDEGQIVFTGTYADCCEYVEENRDMLSRDIVIRPDDEN